MSSAQDSLFRWGNPEPSMGECCACGKAPVARFRFNLIVEDAFSRQTHTQLLCKQCTSQLLCMLVGQSVEPTPQAELNRLDGVMGDEFTSGVHRLVPVASGLTNDAQEND